MEPERLVFTSDGYESLEAADPVTKSITTVTMKDISGKTELSVHTAVLWSTPEAAQYLAGMDATWKNYLEQLAEAMKAG